MFYLASSLPIEEVVVWAHDVGAKVLVDACQSVPHMVVDVQKLNVDFLVASSHKVGIVSFFLRYLTSRVASLYYDNHASDVWTYRHWVLIW